MPTCVLYLYLLLGTSPSIQVHNDCNEEVRVQEVPIARQPASPVRGATLAACRLASTPFLLA